MIRLPRWFIVIVTTMFVLSPGVIGVMELFKTGFILTSFAAVVIFLAWVA